MTRVDSKSYALARHPLKLQNSAILQEARFGAPIEGVEGVNETTAGWRVSQFLDEYGGPGTCGRKNGRRRGLGKIEFALNLWIQTFSLQFFNERRSIHMK